MQRLQSAIGKIVGARNNFELGPWFMKGARFPEGTDMAKLGNIRSRLRFLPPPAFLVPSIIEALHSTEFGFCTYVVPGEADAYCADYARDHGGIILTNDSDLLIHDLGYAGSVVFLSDITLPASKESTALQLPQFQPKHIAEWLGLENIIQLACMMDPNLGFTKNLQLAQGLSTDSLRYSTFSTQFNMLIKHSKLSERAQSRNLDGLLDLLRWLDTRVSEFILQNAGGLLAHAHEDLLQDECLSLSPMYLPILLEDPQRTAVWITGCEIRCIGYSLILLNSSVKTVEEVRRRGTNTFEVSIALADSRSLTQICASLLDSLDNHFQRNASCYNIATSTIWQIYGLKIVCETTSGAAKLAPPKSEMIRLLKFEYSVLDSWAWVHLQAQLQAALYSLRMLKQFVDVVFAVVPVVSQDQDLMRLVGGLKARLATLPSLKDIFETHIESTEKQKKDLEPAVENLYTSLGIEEAIDKVLLSKREKKKVKKRAKEHKALSKEQQTPQEGTGSANMFDVLKNDN